MYVEIDKEDKRKIELFIDHVLNEVSNDFNKVRINPTQYTDIIYLASIAIRINKDKMKWEKIGYQLCYEMKCAIENYRIYENDISMLGGFGYFCFAVRNYSNASGNLRNFSKSIHELLLTEVRKKAIELQLDYTATKSSEFDSISGISGALYYLLDYDEGGEQYESTIISAIDYLIKLTKTHSYREGEKVFNFHIPKECQFLNREKKQFPEGNYNFGMAHGMIGPLTALSKAYAKGYSNKDLLKAIKIFFKVYETFSIEVNGTIYWTAQLPQEKFKTAGIDEDMIHYASSWCYGNTGILVGLLITCENMGWKQERDKINQLLTCAMNKSLEDFYLVSPALCHGFSSVLAGKICLFDREEKKELQTGLSVNIDGIITLSERNTVEAKLYPDRIETEEGRLEGYMGEYSLLNGVTGIVAVFADLLYEINDYRKLLMMG